VRPSRDRPGGSALETLFARCQAEGEAAWFSLPGGAVLFTAGDPSDQLYFVRAGRLGVFRIEEGHDPQFVGVIRAREPVGEMALIAGSPHTGHVVALRDTELLSLSRKRFFEACEEDPAVMIELARLMIRRTRQGLDGQAAGQPSVFGFVALSAGLPVRPLIDRIAQELGRLGRHVTVVGAEAQQAPTQWFSQVEDEHDLVCYVAEADDGAWRQLVARQVDRLFRLADGTTAPAAEAAPGATLQAQGLADLILVQKKTCRRPRGSAAWVEVLNPTRLFQMRRDHAADAARMARLLAGQSVGLVLSGGGARAYAHVGAIRALRERKTPIDFIGGASMGAVVAAGVAMGWDDPELDRRIRQAFVDSSPLADIAVPLLAMTRGEKVRRRLTEHFGEVDIADLWLPFFCVSSNLTRGAYQQHRRGKVREALRASIALPGVLPPATQGLEVLVDGAVLKNFPADVMRDLHAGPVVGVDVTRGRSITAEDVAQPGSVLKWLRSGRWRQGPPIVSLLMRAATVSSGRDLAAAREAADLLVTPEVTVEIRDWSDYAPAVEAGYKAMNEALDRLERPVQLLRTPTAA
jgi:NTE family protein